MKKEIDFSDVKVAFEHKSNAQLNNTIWIYKLIQNPRLVKLLTKLTEFVLKYNLPFKFLIKKTVFKVFCAGQNRSEAALTMTELKKHGVETVLDYVAEGDNSEESFSQNLHTILRNICFVNERAAESFVGVKLSGLEDVEFIRQVAIRNVNPKDKDRMDAFISKIHTICTLAVEKNIKVYFDAEEHSTQEVYDFVVEKMMVTYNTEKVLIYNTLQMYFTDRISYLNYSISEAKTGGYKLGIKLVRGAYVEKERDYAKRDGIQSPVFETKEETDQSFNEAVRICLTENGLVNTCLATHNQQSIELAIALIDLLEITDHRDKIYFSQLFGMSDNLTFNLAKNHYNSSKYVPYGELEKAIPYLLRRAEENSSIEGQVSREYELLLQEKKRRSA
ncbi:MAG: proline dehydrogenase family protein [Crocinitomicaceae bacterium]